MGSTEMARAYAAVCSKMGQPRLDSTNPHFGSRFASLKEVKRVVDEACSDVGGIHVTTPSSHDQNGQYVDVVLVSDEGETMTLSSVPYQLDANPQKTMSAITYARRYALTTAFSLVADEDDDGNAASDDGSELRERISVGISKIAERDGVPYEAAEAGLENKCGYRVNDASESELERMLGILRKAYKGEVRLEVVK